MKCQLVSSEAHEEKGRTYRDIACSAPAVVGLAGKRRVGPRGWINQSVRRVELPGRCFTLLETDKDVLGVVDVQLVQRMVFCRNMNAKGVSLEYPRHTAQPDLPDPIPSIQVPCWDSIRKPPASLGWP